MKYNPEIHHRRSIRLKDFDYSLGGGYFLTICTQERENLFGEINNGEMQLNAAGRMVLDVWTGLPNYHTGFEMDEFVVMPNHVHGIIILTEPVGAGLRARPVAKTPPPPRPTGQPRRVAPTITLPDVVHHFKSYTTAQYRKNVAKRNWPPFPGKLWQRNYYEHIIRTEKTANRIRQYIAANPFRWEFDRDNPDGKPDKIEETFWKTFETKK